MLLSVNFCQTLFLSLCSLRILVFCFLNPDLFSDHYTLEEDMLHLFMEENRGQDNPFKKPAFPHNQGTIPSDSSTGDKRSLEDLSLNSISYIKDDGTAISSRRPEDWGVDIKHQFVNNPASFKRDCFQMANVLEYYNKVYNHRLVGTCYDNNPFLNESGTEFFENFTDSRNIKPVAGNDQIANTVNLRNAFRIEANKNN